VLGEGLAPWIEPASYDLTFEVGEYSDAASPVGAPVGEDSDAASPVGAPDGSPGYPRRVSVACTKHLVVPAGTTVVTIDVDFHGARCEVAVGR
jgi:hypothetical protein